MEGAEERVGEGAEEASGSSSFLSGEGPSLRDAPIQSEAMKTLMNTAAVRRAVLLKSVARDDSTSYEVDCVKFDILGSHEISQMSQLEVLNREIYVNMTSTPHPFGVLDLRLGESPLRSFFFLVAP